MGFKSLGWDGITFLGKAWDGMKFREIIPSHPMGHWEPCVKYNTQIWAQNDPSKLGAFWKLREGPILRRLGEKKKTTKNESCTRGNC